MGIETIAREEPRYPARLCERLGADTLLLGWGLDDDNTHSPNEKFCLDDYHRGTLSSAQLWEELAKLTPTNKTKKN